MSADIERHWKIGPYVPLRVEFQRDREWQRAGQELRENGPALRLSLLCRVQDSPDGLRRYKLLETYRVPLDTVKASTRPCLICGQPVKNSRLSAVGHTLHRACKTGRIPDAVAEDLRLFGTLLPQVRRWVDLAYPPLC